MTSRDPTAAPEIVNLPELPIPSVRSLSGLERAAFYLAGALFCLIAAITLALMFDWLMNKPPAPDWTRLPADPKASLETFRTVSDIAWDRTSRAFDLFVLKSLLPIFATVVGYLLGKRAG